MFIVFEGGDGAGKTTQTELLAARLSETGHEVVVTRQPGGTRVGASIRNLVLSRETQGLSPRCEALLFAADKAQHVDEVVRPALKRGAVVISDRYVDSAIAYQGAGRNLGVDEVTAINAFATAGLQPDVTVLLDVDPVMVQAKDEKDRIEQEPGDFHHRLRELFLALAEREPERYLVLPGRVGAPEATAELVWQRVEVELTRKKSAR